MAHLAHRPLGPSPLTHQWSSDSPSRKSSPSPSINSQRSKSASSVVVNTNDGPYIASASSPPSEQLRAREVLRYFTPPSPPPPPQEHHTLPVATGASPAPFVDSPASIGLDGGLGTKPGPTPSTLGAPTAPAADVLKSSEDPALTAFAQLLALKLDRERSMISLIDKTKQYVVAEATRTLPITSPVQKSALVMPDGLWLGCETIPREGGLCENTLQLYPSPSGLRADSTEMHTTVSPTATSTFSWEGSADEGSAEKFSILEIEDLTQDTRFRDRDYVLHYPYLRFYAGTPLRTKRGYNIGSLCVVDSMPGRLSKEQKRTLGRMGMLVMQHLELTAERKVLRRTQLMAESLGRFVARKYADDAEPLERQDSVESDAAPPLRRGTGGSSSSTGSVSPGTPDTIHETFSRASILIREALVMDGVVFVDADKGFDTMLRSVGHAHNRIGGILGWSSSLERSEGATTNAAQIPPPHVSRPDISSPESDAEAPTPPGIGQTPCEAIIHRMLDTYPRGTILSFEELSPTPRQPGSTTDEYPFPDSDGVADASAESERMDEEDMYASLRKFLPGCAAVIFVPLLRGNGKPYASAFAWTRDARRVPAADELQYLRAFASTAMGEVARIGALSADAAKGAFISSVSHELRSPLHGVLAAAEFLMETTLDSFQRSFVNTIESCGRMLLDTINSVLDFSKLGSLVKDHRVRRGLQGIASARSGVVSLIEETDISRITEQVVESVYAGYEFRGVSRPGFTETETAAAPRESGVLSNRSGEANLQSSVHSAPEAVTVILDIDKRDNWSFVTQLGGVRRVMMNIFGNALKYTDAGWVRVQLQAEDIPAEDGKDYLKTKVTFTVTDSGRGISREFLKTRLFTPFSQEDALANGTGLGMSIVRQIVQLLGGDIDVRSRVGVGTKVVITMVLKRARPAATVSPPTLKDEWQEHGSRVRALVQGKTICLCGFDTALPSSHDVDGVATSSAGTSTVLDRAVAHAAVDGLRKSLARYAREWYAMDVVFEPLATTQADVILANESPEVLQYLQENSDAAFDVVPRKSLIMLCSNVARYKVYAPRADSGNIIDFVSKPCGPIKLGKALQFCFEQSIIQANAIMASPLGSPVSPIGLGAVRFSPAVHSHASKSEPMVYIPGHGLAPSGTSSSSVSPPLPPGTGSSSQDSEQPPQQHEQQILQRTGVSVTSLKPALRSAVSLVASSSKQTLDAPETKPNDGGTIEPNLQKMSARAAPAPLTNGMPSNKGSAGSPSGEKTPTAPYPNRLANASASTSSPSQQAEIEPPGLTPNVLVVEDNSINLMLLATFLKKRRYPFATTENGLLGLQAVQNSPKPFDIILMDLQMPVMNGVEAIRRIRQHEAASNGALKPSLIIALTGLAGSENVDEAFDAGVDMFFTKPVSFKRVDEEIEAWRQRVRDEARTPLIDDAVVATEAGVEQMTLGGDEQR